MSTYIPDFDDVLTQCDNMWQTATSANVQDWAKGFITKTIHESTLAPEAKDEHVNDYTKSIDELFAPPKQVVKKFNPQDRKNMAKDIWSISMADLAGIVRVIPTQVVNGDHHFDIMKLSDEECMGLREYIDSCKSKARNGK